MQKITQLLNTAHAVRQAIKRYLTDPQLVKNSGLEPIISYDNTFEPKAEDTNLYTNWYYLGRKVYCLTEEHAAFFYALIQESSFKVDPNIFKKTLEKQTTLKISNLEEAIAKSLQKGKRNCKNNTELTQNTTVTSELFVNILEILTIEEMQRILIKIFHQVLIQHVLSSKMQDNFAPIESEPYFVSYVTLAVSIGKNIIMVLLNKFPQLYKIIYPKNCEKTPEIIQELFLKKHLPLASIQDKNLVQYFKEYYNISCNQDFAKFLRIALYKNFPEIIEVNLTKIEQKSLKEGGVLELIITEFNLLKEEVAKKTSTKSLTQISSTNQARIGSIFIEIFKEDKIFTEERKNRSNFLRLNKMYEIDLLGSAATFKPTLTPNYNITNVYKSRTPLTIRDKETSQEKYKFNFDANRNTIHPGHNYKIELKNKTKDLLKFNHVNYCVIRTFFMSFTKYFSKIINIDRNNIDESNKTKLLEFCLSIYDIDLWKITHMDNLKDDPAHQEYVKELEGHCINFGDLTGTQIKKKYKKLLKNLVFNKQEREKEEGQQKNIKFDDYIENINANLDYKTKDLKDLKDSEENARIAIYRLYIKYIDKVTHTKHFLIGLLNELYMYKDFHHFHLPKFISYTGRMGTQTFYTNLQAYKIVKTMVGIKKSDGEITRENYATYKQIFKAHIKDNNIKKEISNTTFAMFNAQTKNLISDCIKHNFIDESGYNTINNWFKSYSRRDLEANFGELLSKTLPLVKKPKLCFLALSQLYTLHFESTIDLIIQLDASTNGLQMIAMLQNDKNLGIRSNLIGDEKSDIYQEFINYFQSTFNIFQQFTFTYLEIHHIPCSLNTSLPLHVIEFLPEEPGENQSLQKYISSILKDYIFESQLFPEANETFKDIIFSFLGITSKNTEQSVLLACEHILKLSLTFSAIFKKNTWLLEHITDRELVKKLVMAAPYGLTTIGGIKSIKKFFHDKAVERGILYEKDALHFLSKFVEVCFTKGFSKTKLSQVEKWLKISEYAKYDGIDSFTMETEYLKWTC